MKQHEIIGYDFEGQLRQIVQKLKINKTFIVTGNESYVSTGAEKRIKNILNDAQILRFSGFQSNPNLDDVRLGIDEINRFRPDVIIAIGGGVSLIWQRSLIFYHQTMIILPMNILNKTH